MNSPHPFADALQIVSVIVRQGHEQREMARRIYANCALVDSSLEHITPDFAMNPDYEPNIRAICSAATQSDDFATALIVPVRQLSDSEWILLRLEVSRRIS